MALILRLLRRRVEEVSPEVEIRIRQLNLSQLEALGEALLDFQETRDL
ncbi:MAG: hypothetical protein BRC44_13145 [Cyanobacteria bacterium QS_4_48_99]|nr:MAG: hypothetical protein BRC44_13145 [Cyanobacteria bacterium QS_4_48_99]